MTREFNFKVIEKKSIKILSVGSILEKFNNNIFPDFMSLDVEGLDEEILKSIDFSSSIPKVICLETISYSETGNGIKDIAYIDFLKDNGHLVYADTYINTIFVLEKFWLKK